MENDPPQRMSENDYLTWDFRIDTGTRLDVCLGTGRRFANARQLTAYLDLVPREHSSGAHTQRGGITKTGTTHVRKALGSAAWNYAHPPRSSRVLQQRQQAVSAEIIAMSWKAQQHLYKRFRHLSQTKSRCVANTAVAQELGIWGALRVETP